MPSAWQSSTFYAFSYPRTSCELSVPPKATGPWMVLIHVSAFCTDLPGPTWFPCLQCLPGVVGLYRRGFQKNKEQVWASLLAATWVGKQSGELPHRNMFRVSPLLEPLNNRTERVAKPQTPLDLHNTIILSRYTNFPAMNLWLQEFLFSKHEKQPQERNLLFCEPQPAHSLPTPQGSCTLTTHLSSAPGPATVTDAPSLP